MKNIISKFFKAGRLVRKTINFFNSLDKATRTISAFKASLEMFEEERVKIWGNPLLTLKIYQMKQNNTSDLSLKDRLRFLVNSLDKPILITSSFRSELDESNPNLNNLKHRSHEAK
ncbi:hypothetical protein [Tenacibaculum maritimum]|uniref:hypothetical protein n=2 Tax=Tenacibaculum maritimum TaxID=107401 RepID=UPI0038911226